MRSQRAVLTGLVLLAIAGRANAVAITVPNSSFEGPAVATYNTPGPIADWSISSSDAGVFNVAGSEAAFNPATPYFNAGFPTDGSQSGYLNNGSMSTANSLGPIQGGMQYTLTIDVARRLDPLPLPTYGIDLLAGGTSFANFTGAANSIAAGDFATETLSFTVTAGSPLINQALGIKLSNDGFGQVNFDNVRLQAVPVPEPGCLSLLGCGLATGIGYCLCRARQATKIA